MIKKRKKVKKDDTKETLDGFYQLRFRLILEGGLVGILTGLVVVAFRFALDLVGRYGRLLIDAMYGRPLLSLFYIGLVLGAAFLVKKIMQAEPLVKGSGIPQVEAHLLGILHFNWLKVLVLKFVGGVMAIGSGLSLGREGPSIQLGAAVGKGVGRVLGRTKIEKRFLITGGASAGLSASFNAPFAGVLFALEEVHKNFSPMVLASALVAAVSADVISVHFFGLGPVLQVGQLTSLPLHYYPYAFLLAVIVGLFGVAYNKGLLKSLAFYQKGSKRARAFKFFIPFLLALVLAFTFPDLLGGGHHLLLDLANAHYGLTAMLVFLLIKFAFTMISYGSGSPGGIFLPLLVLGGLTGAIYGNFLFTYLGLPAAYINHMIVFAMLAYFTAIVRAPITGILLISEMTGSLQQFLPLTLVAIVAYLVADLMHVEPIYDSLMERAVPNMPTFVTSEHVKTLLEFCVYTGSQVEGREVQEVAWPKYCLVVSIKRGHKEIIPHPTTRIQPGDVLVVLTNESSVRDTRLGLEVLLQEEGQ